VVPDQCDPVSVGAVTLSLGQNKLTPLSERGGIDSPLALGLQSTYAIGASGRIEGRAIAVEDEIPIGTASGAAVIGASIPSNLCRGPRSPAESRVLPGLYGHRIPKATQNGGFGGEWTAAPQSDRTGYRFRDSRPLEFIKREHPFSSAMKDCKMQRSNDE